MTSLPIPNTPIRGPAADLWRAHWRACAALALAGLPLWASAHGVAAEPVPDEVGARVGIAAAVTYLQANQELPSNGMNGFLLQGDAGMDRRRWGLEHGMVDLGWRFGPQWAAYAALGKHDNEPAHTEALWVQVRQPQGDATWLLTMGRQRPAMGQAMEHAGHLDRFSQLPLAQRAALNEAWIDDGLQLGWRGKVAGQRVNLDAGLWSGQAFPGAAQGSVVPTLHAGTEWVAVGGHVALDGFAAHLEPRGRGTKTSSLSGGHSHEAPVCNDSARGTVACFDGRTELAGASARWQSHDGALAVTAAGWLRRDQGGMASANGQARYQGDQRGGWLEGVWRFQPQWEAGLRAERLQARHTLNGPGASLLAQETRLDSYRPARRNVWMLGYTPRQGLDLRLEAGNESVAGQRVRYAMLRAVWRLDDVLAAVRRGS